MSLDRCVVAFWWKYDRRLGGLCGAAMCDRLAVGQPADREDEVSGLRFTRVALSVATTLVVALAFVLAVSAAGSAPAEVDSLPKGVGGYVTAFAFGPRAPNTVYVATLGGRVYKTTDGGGHWQSTRRLSTRVDALTSDPRRPGTLYAGTGVAVYKTVNGGRSWRGWNRGLLPPPPYMAPGQSIGAPGWRHGEGWVSKLAVDPTDSKVVYAGTGGGIKKSTDGGRSWKTVLWRGRFMGIWGLVIAPTQPQVVYAGVHINGPAKCGIGFGVRCRESWLLYKSADGGRTWGATRLGLDYAPGALVLDPQVSEHPVRSRRRRDPHEHRRGCQFGNRERMACRCRRILARVRSAQSLRSRCWRSIHNSREPSTQARGAPPPKARTAPTAPRASSRPRTAA